MNDVAAFASTRRDKIMGAVVLGTLLALLYLAIVRIDGSGGTASDETYRAVLSQAYGIAVGGTVSVSGVSVGTIRGVSLETDGRVRLTLYLSPKYAHFYRVGSRLKIDSQLGIGSVIGGSGLTLLPGPEGATLLPPGSELPVDEPESLEQLVEQWNLRDMANTLQTTLRDIGEIVASVKDNQSYLIDALNRTAEVSANMVEATAGIPRLVEHIDAVLVRLDRTLASVDGQASSLGSDLGDLMAQTSDLTVSLTALVEAVEPSARRSPVLIDNLTQVSREAEVLLNRLNHHWLLGGDEQVARPGPRLDMPGDDALYSGGGLNQKGGRNE